MSLEKPVESEIDFEIDINSPKIDYQRMVSSTPDLNNNNQIKFKDAKVVNELQNCEAESNTLSVFNIKENLLNKENMR